MRDQDYFAEWLSRTLVERDIPGGKVAEALGVNDSAISRWRNGKARPSLESAMALAEFLGVHPVRLAVTAGLMKEKQAGMSKLPLPEDTKTRVMVKEQIMGIRGLTSRERQAMMEAYDNMSTAEAKA